MKTTKFFYGMAAFATLGLASCSSDAPDNPGQIADRDMTRYITVNISGVMDGTRASEDPTFSEGTPEESKVNKVYFVFYDNAGNPVGNIVTLDEKDLSFTPNSATPTPSTNSTHSAVVGVELLKNEAYPAKVLCYINPISPEGMLNPINVIETLKRGEFKKDGFFAMSNSVYYDDKGILVNATPVAATFATLKEAEDNLKIANGEMDPTAELTQEQAKQNVTDIYVERYAAKINFTWAQKDGANENPEYTGIAADPDGTITHTASLVFNPKGWAINGEGKDFYITKTFRAQDALGGITGQNYTYDALLNENMLGANSVPDNWIWNQPANHRSFWSCSPAYYSTQYPEVASQYNPATMELDYQTWENLMTNNAANSMTTKSAYMNETTVGTQGLHNATNHYAALPSVIVNGSYRIKYDGALLPENTTFYLYGTGADGKKNIYFENAANSVNSAVSTAGTISLLKRLGNRQQVVFIRKKGVTDVQPNKLTDAQIAKVMKIGRPDDEVLNKQLLASRKVTLQLNGTYEITEDGVTYELVYVDGSNWTAINGDNANAVNANIMKAVNYADKYTNGMAYYFIPILHYGWYREGNPNSDATKGIVWADTKVGDFGVVRNHVYDIKVTSVTGLATAIANPKDPIIPPQETVTRAVAYRINILNWAIVPTQEVDL